ncbi:MAG: hypothetical protein P4L48_22870 [Mycobacterium sp.]|nr:hypothetical protein [Mycobacterium sp.]
MSTLTRRDLLAAGLLLPTSGGSPLVTGGRLLASGGAPVFRPATTLGLNIGGFGQNTLLAPNQQSVLRPLGVSFIRGNLGVYYLVSPSASWQWNTMHTVLHNVLSVRPYAGDNTQLELTIDQSIYAIGAGEPLVLSIPVAYTLANGAKVTLPAQTTLTCTGGTWSGNPGTGNVRYQVLSGTVRVPAGAAMADNGPQVPLLPTALLHQNFYLAGNATPRPEVATYTALAGQWLAQGFGFDIGAAGSSWDVLINLFGAAAVEVIREQEWAWWGSQGWPASRVLISDENEDAMDYMPGNWHWNWQNRWKGYFQNTLYPRMRAILPNYTLGFGFPAYASPDAVPAMDWWPNDPNTVLRIHAYPSQTGAFPNLAAPASLDAYWNWVSVTVQRLNIPQVHVQEFGTNGGANTNPTMLANLRRSILKRGWLAAPWAAYYGSNPGQVATFDANGLIVPVTSSGAFGFN